MLFLGTMAVITSYPTAAYAQSPTEFLCKNASSDWPLPCQ
eukprot:COSAG02_NODE_58390_length_277_cov_1.140449_1_plen_39_part_01